MVARTVELSDELQRQIAELARQTGRAEADLLHEAIATYVQIHRVPHPRSDGTIDDSEFAARDIDDWLAATWRPV
jgi:predicted transcriptional regulator